MKKKINNLNISEELKDSLEKLFLESDDSEDITSSAEIDHISDSSDEETVCPCKQGVSESGKENSDSNDDYYKLISQFKDSDINVLTRDHILEFLKSIKDQELRSRIIENLDDIPSTSTHSTKTEEEFIPNNNPYSMTEVYKLMKQRYEDSHKSPTTLNDLYGEINNLKDEIKMLKQINKNLDLIAQNMTHNEVLLYEEFKKQYLATKHQQEGETSYAQVLSEEDNIPSYHTNTQKEIIFLLEDKDLQWKDNPWLLMNRYLDVASYAATSYKQRQYYEQILKESSCEITHFYPGGTKTGNIYNFSKIIIKKIISIEEWGISPLRE
ncbi:hypothetical protein M9H77_22509 [Catharanthus roseus]|uniref:Uncharacterized protein n=1 Tax=Catharanthus roseus TaxID=4058 RepID=A0ACC0ARE4_CATRO|nr:hypothetical protein M9H77_22509 [Catharanthus roseus]